MIGHARPYADFTFEAAVDWVEVTIELPRPTQPRHLRGRMPVEWGRPYVHAHTEHPSGAATVFSFRVQDPAGPAAVMAGLRRLLRPGEHLDACQVSISGIEVALDAYHVAGDDQALQRLACDLFTRQGLMPRSDIGPRVCPPGDAGSTAAAAATPLIISRGLENGWTINHGQRGGEFERRWYVKRHDSLPSQPYRPLPAVQHRARSEVTLRGARLPFTTLAEWGAFRFETLRHPYFAWRLPTGDLRQLPPSMGLRRRLGRVEGAERSGERRKTLRNTVPDAELHRHAKNALERLTRRQRRG